MANSRRKLPAVALPKNVTRQLSRGREYYYWQAGRGTPQASERIRLPDDPQSPEFWQVVRALEVRAGAVKVYTFGDLLDEFMLSKQFKAKRKSTQAQYRARIAILRKKFGPRLAADVRPNDLRIFVEDMTPGTANNVLGLARAVSVWAEAYGKLERSFVTGLKGSKPEGGHKPWTDAQIAAVRKLPAMLRRAIMIELYTGQRGSDAVRLHPGMIDDGGFRLEQKKTGREVWIPILPELAAEMATWPKQPGPYLRAARGGVFSREHLGRVFRQERKKVPELAGCTMHGLRATAVINLRRHGLTSLSIGDFIGMSPAMIDRYCRFADKKASGKAAVLVLEKAKKAT